MVGGFVDYGRAYLGPPVVQPPPISIDSLDRRLIAGWHEGWHPATLDVVAPWWRDKSTWILLYVGLVVWMLWRERWLGLLYAAGAGAAVGLADYTAAGIIKPLVARLRPCRTLGLVEHLDVLIGCGSGYSFPSAHAANHFALATFLAVTFFAERPVWRALAFLWALSIALAQVYVGVHFPTDILAGAGIGSLLGALLGYASLATARRLGLSSKPAAPRAPFPRADP